MSKQKMSLLVTIIWCVASFAGGSALAQSGQQTEDRMRLPPVTVNVYKEPDDASTLPVSVTAVPFPMLRDAGVGKVSDASIFAPNTFFSEFTARKLSNARFRGIGSSPSNPGITTYIDGVPQFNTNSSSVEFTDIEQVEFVRGAQSALFGRNALGGLISVQSRRPVQSNWTGSVTVPLANHSEWDARASASGPLGDKFAVGLTLGKSKRDGFTVNSVTGNDLDYRDGSYGKAQFLWTPSGAWETRFIVSGERARDGDYGLGDVGALRQTPFKVMRDFEGFTNRDIWSTTLQNRYEGSKLSFSTTTGFVKWKTQDLTDLDYTPLPLITRRNSEKDLQFTQEVRLASSETAPVTLGDNVRLRWQTGVFLFTQRYDQDAINNFAPFLLSPQITFPVSQQSPLAELDDVGVGVYGQATTTFSDSFDLTVGARVDRENKDASLSTFYSPVIAPPNDVAAEKSYSNVSPNFAASYRFGSTAMLYSSVGRGYKAGGFNAASPAGNESYGEEDAWHVEGGVKTLLANGKVSANASVFFIDWNSLQLNVPNPNAPEQFFIANVGGARSKGAEFELNARPHQNLDVFGSLGFTHARFTDGTSPSGQRVDGKKLPSTPDYTLTLGAQVTRPVNSRLIAYGRGEVWFNGGFEYDDANTGRQNAYSIANFRAGVRNRYVFAEVWLKNAFDTKYIPIAFAYTANFAPSGFLGEMGAPRRVGVTMGVTF
jgi:iron complex outermembrane receptor protein